MTKFLDDFSAEVWNNTYKHSLDSNINDTLRRVAFAVSSVEKGSKLQNDWGLKFYDLLSGFKMCAGGRILANAGTNWKGVTLMNCFVGPKPSYDQDSIEGIFQVLKNQVLTLKSEGGWGMNFSFIRPRGSFIYGIGVETPGAVKYAEIFNTTSDVITAGSGKKSKKVKGKIKIRKGAMMGVLDCWHPDVEEWITAKLQGGRLSKFNLSVNCSNEFMDKVSKIALYKEKQKEAITTTEINSFQVLIEGLDSWDLIFPDTRHERYKTDWNGDINTWKAFGYPVIVYKTIKVSDLWQLIMTSTFTRNDPGVLFLDRANETHCWNYGGPESFIAATNPCGEQALPFGFVCNLGSMNLTQYVNGDVFEFSKFSEDVRVAVRFLDNVNDLSNAPLPEYEKAMREKRRIGLGVMGWGSLLYMLRIRFASIEAENLKEEIMRILTSTAIDASVELAREKGMFIGCKEVQHANHIFFQKIGTCVDTLCKMQTYGIRNSALFSCQPTGNTSILANIVSGGIEPVFMAEYTRTVIVDECPQELLPLVPKYWEGEFKENETFKWVNEGNDQILRGIINNIVYKIDKNRGLTKEVHCEDYGVRWLKARNLWDAKADWAVTASNLSVNDHLVDMTGFSKWIDSSISKTVNLPNDYPYSDFQNLYLKAYKSGVLKGITTYRAGTMMNVLASKDEKAKVEKLAKTSAPKRPEELNGEIFTLNYKKEKLFVAIGFWSDKSPYEVFCGKNQDGQIKNDTGLIVKNGRGKYIFKTEKAEHYLNNGHSDENADVVCRMLSASLRHGCDISFLVHQLEKTEGDLTCFAKVLARTLKRYIKDGTEVQGEDCPICNGKFVRQEGCCVCVSCGYSKCS